MAGRVTPKNTGPANICLACNQPIVGTCLRLSCDVCKRFVHGTQICCGLQQSFIRSFINNLGKGAFWKCTSCIASGGVGGNDPALSQALTQLGNSMIALTQKFEQLSIDMASVKTDLANTHSGPIDASAMIRSPEFAVMVKEQVREIAEQDKRKDSVIIRGIKTSSTSDFNDVFNGATRYLLGGTPISLTDVVVLGPELARGRIADFNGRKNLLSASQKLGEPFSPFAGIFISRDLTYLQRKERIEKKKRRDEEARSVGSTISQRQRPPASPLNLTAAMATGTPSSAAIPSVISSPAVSSGYTPHPLMSVTSSVASAIRNFIPGAPLIPSTADTQTPPVTTVNGEPKNGV